VDTSKQEALWVLRAQCDDREALELLLRSVQPSLRRYLRGIVGSADADDILQEVLVIVFRKLTWLEYPELFRPWAFRIASRAAFRHLKREKRREAREDAAVPSVPALDPPPSIELSIELLEQLESNAAISPASRAVLVLHFQEDLSLPEVAEVLEIPLGTVKSRLAYGLTTLRKQWAKGGV
jgi:RNA polymerase sigma-70 factor (ECF subfamily)